MLFKKNQLLVFLFTIIFSSFTFSQITCNDTSWGKAIDFSGSNEHAKQVNPSSNNLPVRMIDFATTVDGPDSSDKTSNDDSAAPWAVAIVFKIDGYNTNQHIWNSGEGASTNNDNIYLRLSAAKSLFLGWGREGDGYNEVRIANQNVSSSNWYGVYIAHKGARYNASNATAANLADAFDIRIMSSSDNFNSVGSNLCTSANWTSTGYTMKKSVAGDFTIGGRGSNRSFRGKVASCVVTTLKRNRTLPTDAEVKKILIDPIGWVTDYKIGESYRKSNSVDNTNNFQLNSTDPQRATQVWLMGDGASDSYSNFIRNYINTSDQNDAKLQLNSMVSNDFETVSIDGLEQVVCNQWQGGQSTDWGTATNWSFGSEPSESDNIKIPSGIDAIISENEDKVVNSITVDSGGSLILSKNSSLSITDSFTNNGTVTLNSDSEKFSSLIVGGSSSGNIVYNRYVNTEGSGEWDLIGSPVDGLSISDFVTTNTTSSPATLATSSSVYAVGVYDNSDDSWTNYTTSTVGDAGNFDIGKGYQMASVNGGTGLLSFTGTVATTDQTQSIINNNGNGSGKRWNLVANPFPSYLNANNNADGTNNFLKVNLASGVIDATYSAIYGWKADGTGYAIYNNSSSATYIAPGQGFWVAAASTSSANLSFTEAMQTATGGDDFIAGRTTSTSFELVLDMHNDDIKVSDTKFYFKEGLTLGLDPGYDAGAFNQSSGLSSRLVEQDNGVGMGINAMPVDVLSNVIVPLTIEQEAGIALKIQIANSTIPEDINVYLEDAMENTFTLLTNESFELLTQTALSGTGRFFIHFTSSTLSTDTAGSTSLLTAYKGKGNAYISVEGLQQFSEPAQLTLYNVLGIKILSKNIQNPSQKEMLSTIGMKTGVYIIKVQAENIVFTKKLIIE